ncbi:hypothetical protein GCM10009788_03650 [Nocardioides humi]|uniref:Uncharacterized protein n=1 Tax=Nocardioides humi TaxID=449461 RepID=A0ABN1ZSP7_9ACTN
MPAARLLPALALLSLLASCGGHEPETVPDGERIADAAALLDSRWELTSEDYLEGENPVIQICTGGAVHAAPDRPVERILLRQDGYVDTTTSCPGSARLPELDRGEDGPDTWELDDEGWLRVSYNDGALRCAADGVREDGFQLICENERQGLVMERRYGTPGIDLPPGVTPPAGIRP